MMTEQDRDRFNRLVALKHSLIEHGLNRDQLDEFMELIGYKEGNDKLVKEAVNVIHAEIARMCESAMEE